MPTQAPFAFPSGKGRVKRECCAGFNGFYNNVLDLGLTIFFTLEGILKAGAAVVWTARGFACAC